MKIFVSGSFSFLIENPNEVAPHEHVARHRQLRLEKMTASLKLSGSAYVPGTGTGSFDGLHLNG